MEPWLIEIGLSEIGLSENGLSEMGLGENGQNRPSPLSTPTSRQERSRCYVFRDFSRDRSQWSSPGCNPDGAGGSGFQHRGRLPDQ
ncbi:MAG: hypothetical protein HOL85_06805 [Rhodospirillaceae bacterium]|nr:hypothetical protein [Rhodospirillaceae bacterium]